MLAAHIASVLARAMNVLLYLLRKNLRSVELKNLRGVVIDPDDSVEKRHGKSVER